MNVESQEKLSRRDVLKLAAAGSVLGVMPARVVAEDTTATTAAAEESAAVMAFELPPLPYAEDALEPYIDARTMGIHHGKHHAGYTRKLNAAIEGTDLVGKSINEILADLNAVPEEIRTAVRNNGGGYANHNLFWGVMSPDGGGEPSGALAERLRQLRQLQV